MTIRRRIETPVLVGVLAVAMAVLPALAATAQATPRGSSDLRGVVLTPTDEPAAQATVRLVDLGSARVIDAVRTDERGAFAFASVEAGEYNVVAADDEGAVAVGPLVRLEGSTAAPTMTLNLQDFSDAEVVEDQVFDAYEDRLELVNQIVLLVTDSTVWEGGFQSVEDIANALGDLEDDERVCIAYAPPVMSSEEPVEATLIRARICDVGVSPLGIIGAAAGAAGVAALGLATTLEDPEGEELVTQ